MDSSEALQQQYSQEAVHINEDNMEDDDENSEGWDEMDAESDTPLTCLFCPKSFKTMAVALEHCKIDHKFDLAKVKEHYNMDCYSYICLVNFIRSKGSSPEAIISCTDPPWLNDIYMKPVLQDDPWLMFDFEDLETSFSNSDISSEINFQIVKSENGLVTLTEQHYAHIKHSLELLTEQIRGRDAALSIATEKMAQMKVVTQNLISNDVSSQMVEDNVASIKLSDDDNYFSTYSHFGIHHEMLSDRVRTLSYQNAINENKESFNGKVVLDLGCGTSILSMFAATAGASKVIGIDQSDIIYYAMDIIRENNLSGKIELIKGKIELADLPVKKVDIIVSEWMGYFLLFEGMLDSVTFARTKYLKPDGLLLPNRCTLNIVGVSDPTSHDTLIGFWSNVYGFKMSCMTKEVIREAVIATISPETVATSVHTVLDLNLYTCSSSSVDFTSEFVLESKIDGKLTAFGGYFDSYFELPTTIVLPTGPDQPPTHWKQTLFYLPDGLPISRGETIRGTLQCRRSSRDKRALEVTFSLNGLTYVYVLT